MVALSELENIVKQSDPNNVAQKHLNTYDDNENVFFQAITNIPSSAKQFGNDIIQPFIHPVKTAKSLKDLGSSVINLIRPGEQGNEQLAKEVGNFFVQRYGSLDNIKKTFATDPVGMLSDVSIILTGGAALSAKAPALAGQTTRIVSSAGKAIDPINVVSKTIQTASPVISKPISQAVGMTTGAGGEAISQAYTAGKVGAIKSDDFTDAMRGVSDAEEVVTDALSGMKDISQGSKTKYVSNIEKLKLDKIPIKFQNLTDEFNKFRQSKIFEGESTLSSAAQKKLKSIDKIIDNWKKNPKLHNAKGLDMLKKRIDAEYPTGLQVGDAGVVVSEMRNIVKKQLLKEAPNYAKVMKAYEEAVTLEKKMLKELSMGNKSGAGTILRKLQSVMRNNANTNWGKRLDYVKLLNEANLDANILSKLAGHSLSSWTPRGLAGVTATGQLGLGSYGLVSGAVNPAGLIPTLLMQSPRVMGEAAHAAGKFSNVADKVLPRASAVGRVTRYPGILEQQNQALKNRGLL